MRIAGGQFKGRILKVPKSGNIRPSTERIREAIFSSLGADIIDADVADLFCGSGALGLEALSRGAKSAIFIDSSASSIAAVKENIDLLGLEKQARVFIKNIFQIRPNFLSDIGIILADPPYKKGYAERLVLLLSLQKPAWNGILVLEHESEWSYAGADYELLKRINFGDSSVSIMFKPKVETV